jgi:hypothetical protein
MSRGLGDYARDFLRNLRAEDMPYGTWLKKVLTNRARAKIAFGCCGHRGEPGC